MTSTISATRAVHDRKVGYNTIEWTTTLTFSDWLFFYGMVCIKVYCQKELASSYLHPVQFVVFSGPGFSFVCISFNIGTLTLINVFFSKGRKFTTIQRRIRRYKLKLNSNFVWISRVCREVIMPTKTDGNFQQLDSLVLVISRKTKLCIGKSVICFVLAGFG